MKNLSKSLNWYFLYISLYAATTLNLTTMDTKSTILFIVVFAIAITNHMTIAGRDSRRRRAERDSNRSSRGRNSLATSNESTDVHMRESLLELESKLNSKVSAIEDKLSWKINDRIRKINHTVEIAHLENLFHLVNNELSLSLENEENQRLTIENLKRVITAQDSQLSSLNQKLERLEDIVVNLTQHIEVSNAEGGDGESEGILQELSNQIQQNIDDEPFVHSQYPKGKSSKDNFYKEIYQYFTVI